MPTLRFGLFEFDDRSGELRREGRFVKLAPQPARVLGLLLARPGEVVLRDELREHLWGADTFVDFERGLNFCILQVRTALADSSDNPRFVQTVPRKGYRFIAPVALSAPTSVPSWPTSVLVPSTSVPSSATSVPNSATSVPSNLGTEVERLGTEVERTGTEVESRGGGRRWVLGAGALIVLAPLAWLAFPGRPAATESAAGPIRVAVLPFVNLTGDAGAADLADALTDEVIAELGPLGSERLAVIARTSAMSYRGSPKTIAEIGRELGAAYLVESSLRRDGGALRIASRLVPAEAQTPTAAWSETFTAGQTTGPDSQTGAAIRLARLIALALLPDRHHAAESRRPPAHDEAWHALMQGRALLNGGTPEAVRQAIARFESAVQQDPGLAAGWAKLAEAWHVLVMMGAAAPAEAYPHVENAADRALAADAALADAHVAQGLVHLWHRHQPADAYASFTRAIALNASHAAARHDLAWTLVALGRDREAIAEITAARDLDPVSVRANADIGWLYLQLRQPAAAERACRHTLAVDARSLEAQACLERAYVQRGLDEAALTAARATLPADADPGLRSGEADAGSALQAIWRWRLARLERLAQTRWVSPYTLATHYAMLGDRARALDALESARDARVGMLVLLDRDPALDPLRDDPRFRALLTRRETAR